MTKVFTAVAFAIVAQAASAQSISLSAGDYAWDNDWGCSDLTIGETFSYTFDGGCDGNIDYTANSVRLEGNRILIDDAYLEIEAAESSQISGTFHFNGANPAVFLRQ